MSICPHCQAENRSEATICQECGKPLAAAASAELPLWLQALNPEGAAEDTVVAQAHAATPSDRAGTDVVVTEQVPVATDAAPHDENEPANQPTNERATAEQEQAPPPIGGSDETDTVIADANATVSAPPAPAPAPADPTDDPPAFATSHASDGGADTVIATKPTTAARPGTPASATPTSETASLIDEDDLPAWLRAYSDAETGGKATNDDDQSWMLGSTPTIGDEQATNDLAQSWQAPPRATAVERTGAAAIFAAPAANPATVTKRERLITPVEPPPVAAQPVAETPPLGATGVPVRLGAGRPIPAGATQATSQAQRAAIIAFIAALLIFLVVLALFVVAPALRG